MHAWPLPGELADLYVSIVNAAWSLMWTCNLFSFILKCSISDSEFCHCNACAPAFYILSTLPTIEWVVLNTGESNKG